MKPGKVRPLALCIFRQDDRIFVAEGRDKVKAQTFYRPLGGRIEFGEYGRETIVRELNEEIGQAVTVQGFLGVLESIFTYEGQRGHEIVLVYSGMFVDPAMYSVESVQGKDDGEVLFTARWVPLAVFRQGTAPLYPTGLLELVDV